MSQPLPTRRQLLTCGLATAGAGLCLGSAAMLAPAPTSNKSAAGRRFRVLMLTYRGTTDVDTGFRSYLSEAGLDVDFVVRDVQQDASRV